MSIASAKTALSSSSEPSESPLGQLRAAHDAVAQFVERCIAELSDAAQRDPDGPSADRQLAELCSRYTNLERQLDADRAEAAQRPAGREELAGLHAALADSRQRNESLRNQLAAARAAEEEQRTALAEIQFEHRNLVSQWHVLQYRVVELAEELSREKQNGVAERQLWNGELAHWRRMLESQFARLGYVQRVPDTRAFASPVAGLPAAEALLDSIVVDCQLIEHHPSSDT